MMGCFQSRHKKQRKQQKEEMRERQDDFERSILPDVMRGPGWKACGNRKPSDKRTAFNRPTPRQVYDALPFVRRYFVYWAKHVLDKEKLFINTFEPLQHKPYYGVPIGGVGCGSMGRDFRGGFCKFSLRPGLVEHKVDVIPANQFILRVRRDDQFIYQKVLSAADVVRNGQLNSWDFSFPKQDMYYRGLYPRSWSCFLIDELGLVVIIRQISPVIPHDYENTSLPVCCFVAEVINKSDCDYDVSIAFTFRNGTGNRKWNREGDCTSIKFSFPSDHTGSNVSGIILQHTISQMKCTYGLGSTSKGPENIISVCYGFNPTKSGKEFWQHLYRTGDVIAMDSDGRDGNKELAVAVCNRTFLPAGKSREMEFSLAWHMPLVRFGSEQRIYKRRYVRFIGRDYTADELCMRALTNRHIWEQKLDAWQNPILEHPKLPSWYKSAIFNELYFMTDGGTLWFEFDDSWSAHETQLSEYTKTKMKKYGRFGYLESWEYRMVNTYDVHFYASFALAQLWPELELTVQSEFTDQIAHTVEIETMFHMEGDRAHLKTMGRIPHDLGNPADDPWLSTNAYVMHDTGKWKDLNLKYVLMSWRDLIVLTSVDDDFLAHTWPAVKMLMNDALEHWDKNGDGMIENFGKADQTYDAWQMEGVSSYCGSLWLAALRVTIEMAKMVKDEESETKFSVTLDNAKNVFVEVLWTGEYFRFCEKSRSRESIMADQLCGIWFLQSVSPELVVDLLPPEMVTSALNKIYNTNVLCFAGGKMGAVNGMMPNGCVDRAYIQADEMWTGVTYAVAAFLIQQGQVQKGFDTASGCYAACFDRTGLQYQTPEAMYETKYYRAIGYMRPLSIWSMQWALERHCQLNTDDEQLPSVEESSNDVALLDKPSSISTIEVVKSYHDQTTVRIEA